MNRSEWPKEADADGELRRIGAAAYWLHNLAWRSCNEFEGFDEQSFWQQFKHLNHRFAEFPWDQYKQVFEMTLGESSENTKSKGRLVAKGFSMNETELDKIEATLKLTIPAEYRRLMSSLHFPSGSSANSYLGNDAAEIIEMNQDRSILQACTADPNAWLCIGSDGGETLYYLNLVHDPALVSSFELETGQFGTEQWELSDFVAMAFAAEQEIQKEESEIAARPWWKFWR